MLEELACNASGIDACFEAGSVPALTSMLWRHRKSREVTEAACSALLRLCASPACCAAIIATETEQWLQWASEASVPNAQAVLDALNR